jgi:hypothetical protein
VLLLVLLLVLLCGQFGERGFGIERTQMVQGK